MTDLAPIGRYEPIRLLGRGGMGTVYLARDPLIDRLVAVKVLAAGFDAAALDRFRREARAAGRLQHEHIATIYDVGDHDGTPFIAMEYVPGDTLATLLRTPGRLELPEALRLVEEACAGLAFAHRAGIVHLDVKPENLIRRDDGRLKVLDFGIARVLETDQTHTRHLAGTLRYMSPEQLSGGAVDRRTDVFAMGCVLYEAIARHPAFTGEIAEIVPRMEGRAGTPLAEVAPGVAPELVRMVGRAMAQAPADRYDDLDVLGRELAAFRRALDGAADQPTVQAASLPTAHTATASPAPVVRSPGRRWLWVGASLAAAIVVGVLAWRVAPLETTMAPTGGAPQASPASAGGAASEGSPAVRPAPGPDGTASREADLAAAREALRGADRAATLRLLRERPYLAVALIDELVQAAGVTADASRRVAEAAGSRARASREYRAGMDLLAESASLEARGQRIDGLAALWQASDAFGRAASPRPAQDRATGSVSAPARTAEAGVPSAPATSPPGTTGATTPAPSPNIPEPGAQTVPVPTTDRPSDTAAPPRPPEPLPQPPAATAATSQPDPADAVRAVLFTYAAAHELRDIGAVRRVYPGLPDEQATALARTFANASSYRMGIRVLDLQATEPTASAQCEVTHELTPKVGSPSRNVVQSRFQLRNTDGTWVIVRIDNAPRR